MIPRTLKTYRSIFALSLLYGLAYNFVNLRLVIDPRDTYADVEPYYLTVINRIITGNFPVESVDSYSPYSSINAPLSALPLGEAVMGFTGAWLSLDIDDLYFLFSFLFVSLIFAVTTKITNLFIRSLRGSAIVASLILLLTFSGSYFLTRPISPQFNMLIWLTGLYLTMKLSLDKRYLLPVSFFIGVSMYISAPYQSVHLGLVFFIMSAFFLRLGLRQRLISWMVVVVINIPQITDYLYKWDLETWQEFLVRSGIIYSHLPSTANTLLFAMISVLLLFIKRTDTSDNGKSLWVSVLCLIVLSQSNVITGRTLQTYHFEEMAKLVLAFSFARFSAHVFSQNGRIQRILRTPKKRLSINQSIANFYIVFALILGFQMYQIPSSVAYHSKNLGSNEVLEAVNSLPEKARVLILDVDTFPYESRLPQDLIYTTLTAGFPISQKEIAERFFLSRGCDLSDVSTLLRNESSLFIYGLLGNSQKHKAWRLHLARFNLQELIPIPRKDYTLLTQFLRYQNAANRFGCDRLVRKYRIQYVVTSLPNASAKPLLLNTKFSYDKVKTFNSSIAVYKLRP